MTNEGTTTDDRGEVVQNQATGWVGLVGETIDKLGDVGMTGRGREGVGEEESERRDRKTMGTTELPDSSRVDAGLQSLVSSILSTIMMMLYLT
jgi:hypothetical protein